MTNELQPHWLLLSSWLASAW